MKHCTIKELAGRRCGPCEGGTPPLTGAELQKLKRVLGRGWDVVEGPRLAKAFKFKNFQEALDFTNLVGAVAEEQGHHPDIALAWGKVGITVWTHAIGGLSENDFVLAAKIEKLKRPARRRKLRRPAL